jgi:thiamine pyrophosphokinase
MRLTITYKTTSFKALGGRITQTFEIVKLLSKIQAQVFFHMLMMATLNSYLLYKKHCLKLRKKPVLHRVFRKEIVKALVAETTP